MGLRQTRFRIYAMDWVNYGNGIEFITEKLIGSFSSEKRAVEYAKSSDYRGDLFIKRVFLTTAVPTPEAKK